MVVLVLLGLVVTTVVLILRAVMLGCYAASIGYVGMFTSSVMLCYGSSEAYCGYFGSMPLFSNVFSNFSAFGISAGLMLSADAPGSLGCYCYCLIRFCVVCWADATGG